MAKVARQQIRRPVALSFHNWSIIEPAKWVGVANFVKAWNDRQFWVSLGFTLKYTVYITPILMILGYLIALLVATNTPLRKFTRAVVFVPVVIGLSVSSLLWYWLFSYHYGLINKGLMDLGIVDKQFVDEFLAAHELLFAHDEEEKEGMVDHSAAMRRVFSRWNRIIPLIGRDGGYYAVEPRTHVIRPATLSEFGRHGHYKDDPKVAEAAE